MFTGIVRDVGQVRAIEARNGDRRLSIGVGQLDLSQASLGDSIAVAGVCLTVVALDSGGFEADVSHETLTLTTIGGWRAGQRVNLEPALRLGDALGGHLVAGHVDGVGEVRGRRSAARSEIVHFRAPELLARYLARKGSVSVDGVSLTVNAVDGSEFDVNLVPHTLGATTLGELRAGSRVNLEIDLLARYAERLLQNG